MKKFIQDWGKNVSNTGVYILWIFFMLLDIGFWFIGAYCMVSGDYLIGGVTLFVAFVVAILMALFSGKGKIFLDAIVSIVWLFFLLVDIGLWLAGVACLVAGDYLIGGITLVVAFVMATILYTIYERWE